MPWRTRPRRKPTTRASATPVTAPVAAARGVAPAAGYDRRIPLALVPVVLALLVVAAATAFAVVRLVRLFRDAGDAASAVAESLDRIAAGAERASTRAASFGPAGDRLQAALARLSVSRARLGVLLYAYAEARTALASFVFVPRK